MMPTFQPLTPRSPRRQRSLLSKDGFRKKSESKSKQFKIKTFYHNRALLQITLSDLQKGPTILSNQPRLICQKSQERQRSFKCKSGLNWNAPLRIKDPHANRAISSGKRTTSSHAGGANLPLPRALRRKGIVWASTKAERTGLKRILIFVKALRLWYLGSKRRERSTYAGRICESMPRLSLQAAPGTYITSASTVIAILRTKLKREIIKGNVNFKLIN